MSLSSSVDYTIFQDSQQSAQDAQLLVRFFHKSREDKKKTEETGVLHLKEVEYVEIRVAGQRDALACRPATFDDKNRFERQYEAFKNRTEMPESGFPIREWAQITSGMAEHLEFINIKTVEQLANASDTNVSKVMNGLSLKEKAKAFLTSRSGEDALRAENEALNERLARLEALMADQGDDTIDEGIDAQMPDPDADKIEPAPAELEPADPAPEAATKPRRSRKKS